jgi:hypothetical protein
MSIITVTDRGEYFLAAEFRNFSFFPQCGIEFHHFHPESDESKNDPVNPVKIKK